MRKLFLLTSILLLSVSWMLAQASSGSSATDQNTSSGSSVGSQSSTDQMNQGAQPGSASSSDQSEPQSRGGYTQSQTSSGASQEGTRGESMSSQQGETSSDMSSSKSSAGMGGTAGSRTIEGCLSETNGKFRLTDNMGNSYELTGKTANLKSHVGHTISVTGKASSGANKPGAMSGEQAGMEQTIRVSSFRHVSGSCKTGAPSSMPSGSSPSGGSSGGSHY